MPSKKKKYNARFPAGRIKKIMQTDEEVGKVAQAVPVIISRTLELFVESLLTKSMHITQSRCAKTLTPSHMKQCILSESRFDFLKDLVKNVPDPSAQEDNENNANEALEFATGKPMEELAVPKNSQEGKAKIEIMANFYTEQQSTSAARMPVIQYGPKVTQTDQSKLSFSIDNIVNKDTEPKVRLELSHLPTTSSTTSTSSVPCVISNVNNKPNIVPASTSHDNIPPLIPISHNNMYGHSSGDNNLYIDEDYDN